jgi:hypothetical protein
VEAKSVSEQARTGAIVININIDGVSVDMEHDTGAEVSVVSKKKFTEFFPGRLKTLAETNLRTATKS